MLCHVHKSSRETKSHEHSVPLGRREAPTNPDNISHTLGELDPRERDKEKIGGPVEKMESVKLDDQHLDRVIQIGS